MRRITLTLAVFVALSTTASAATDGSLDDTSTGTSDISVTITDKAQITGIADITESDYASGGLDISDDVCIYTNTATHHYLVTATGDGASNAFTIADGSNTIPYTVRWKATAGAGAAIALTTATISGQITGATNTYPCVTDNAAFRIAATHNNIMSVPSGTYTGTLTILITPDPT